MKRALFAATFTLSALALVLYVCHQWVAFYWTLVGVGVAWIAWGYLDYVATRFVEPELPSNVIRVRADDPYWRTEGDVSRLSIVDGGELIWTTQPKE